MSPRRIFHTAEKITELEVRKLTQSNVEPKPRGLWYSCGDEWWAWLDSEMPDWKSSFKHAYELELIKHKSNVLFLKSIEDLLDFSYQYAVAINPPYPWPESKEHINLIDWQRVAQEYGGIEICPYQYSLRLDPRVGWYYGWDVASGCIWDHKAIKSIRYLGVSEEVISLT